MKRIVLALLVSAPAYAISVDEVKQLAQGGISDEVILAQIQADGSTFTLAPAEILDLKQAGVSDPVLKAMIETRRPDPKEVPEGPGSLSLSNDTDRPLSALVSAEARTVFLYHGRFQDRLVLDPGEERRLELPAGTYRVRWIGEKASFRAPLQAGSLTRIVATRLETEDYEALHVSILKDEEEADAGVLKVFREAPPPLVAVPAPAYPYAYGPPPPSAVSGAHTHRRTPFIGPGTLLGAGLGAVIGHQSGERDKGAAVGAVLGHLLDHLDP